ncbi:MULTISPECIES: SDR family NAD(P)-dependent oxidoreductase [Bacteroidaceae]|uniref:SDR family NAD(P)-dependent oxidoreductase n=1 Tax=Bacteroides acidifaciens TaxID=85831 RepID=A0A7K3MMN8_9BACE|nr:MULTISPECIES: SDR family NAD(P)-dependent oxidoreductase [Bacteroidaceae]MBF0728541.1 SDR family NAD(P)-dependent oxidoreductase [Bacteroides acidifaciens]MBF0833873.1 SDR family NAD(P)-dependent oxidoreductase [Bacteroides acidifaciens]NDO55737.1 SDR family NAD(P)-dependent oxidoreductase [Bacteroides acidifaciens]TFU51791.1 SDR family NAD(P)-dependent oxidoreductase [Bacteroides acidifaciens]
MQKIIIIGATSGIGRGLTEAYIQEDCLIGIIGRRENLLQEIYTQDKNKLFYQVCDITDTQTSIQCLETLVQEMGGMDILIICAGTGELNPELAYQLEEPTLLTNVIGFTNIADWGFRYFEQQKSGHLVTISSVGGTRGSGIAPAYNASKAYQINYMEGLRQKATQSPYPIYTTDVRPGFVNTAMAKGEGLFWVTPVDKAVRQIKEAIHKKKKVAFISKRWKYVVILFRLIPSAIYCRM